MARRYKVVLVRTVRVETEVEFPGNAQQPRAWYRSRDHALDLIQTGNIVSDMISIAQVEPK